MFPSCPQIQKVSKKNAAWKWNEKKKIILASRFVLDQKKTKTNGKYSVKY